MSVAYPDEVITHKLRLCERHFVEEMQLVRELLAEVDFDSSVGLTCLTCDKDKAAAVYAKMFDQGEEPVTYAGDFCAEHASLVVLTLKGSLGRLMTGR